MTQLHPGQHHARPWTSYATRGAAFMSYRVAPFAVLVLLEAARTGKWRMLAPLLVLLLSLWIPGAAAGLAYGAAATRGAGHRARWVVAGVVAAAVLLLETTLLLRLTLFAGPAPAAGQEVTAFLLTHPAGMLLWLGVGAGGGLITGWVYRDRPPAG